jgi:hypothetical protein
LTIFFWFTFSFKFALFFPFFCQQKLPSQKDSKPKKQISLGGGGGGLSRYLNQKFHQIKILKFL